MFSTQIEVGRYRLDRVYEEFTHTHREAKRKWKRGSGRKKGRKGLRGGK